MDRETGFPVPFWSIFRSPENTKPRAVALEKVDASGQEVGIPGVVVLDQREVGRAAGLQRARPVRDRAEVAAGRREVMRASSA